MAVSAMTKSSTPTPVLKMNQIQEVKEIMIRRFLVIIQKYLDDDIPITHSDDNIEYWLDMKNKLTKELKE